MPLLKAKKFDPDTSNLPRQMRPKGLVMLGIDNWLIKNKRRKKGVNESIALPFIEKKKI